MGEWWEDFAGAEFYRPHALADSSWCIWITEKMLEFTLTVVPTLSIYLDSLYHTHTHFTALRPGGKRCWGFVVAVASAGPYANNLLLAPDNHTNTSSLNFYRPDAFPDAQPTVTKH